MIRQMARRQQPESPAADDCGTAARGHDRTAALYRSHGRVILAKCRRLLRDAQAAEDAVQEVFIRAAGYPHNAPRGKEAQRWLTRVATNYCLNQLRNRSRSPQLAYELAAMVPDLPVSYSEDRAGDRELVRRVLKGMPEKLRAAAVLRHVDGMHDREVATALGVSRRTVVYRLSHFQDRARRMLGAVDLSRTR